MLPFKLVYHPRYDLNLGAHVFPSQKFRLLYELLLSEKIAAQERHCRARPARRTGISFAFTLLNGLLS